MAELVQEKSQDQAQFDELLAGYPVCISFPVAWGEMDALGHVSNVVYIRWLENGRVAYFARLGNDSFLEGSGIGPILASIQCRYKAPVVYPDTIIVGTRVREVGDDRMTFAHRVISTRLGRVVAEGEGVMVSYDYTQRRKAPLPEIIRQRIRQLEDTLPGEAAP